MTGDQAAANPTAATPMTFKGRAVSLLSEMAVATPWRGSIERVLVHLGHEHPNSRTVLSVCRHFGTKLIEYEGKDFARVAKFESGGTMFCGGEKQIAPLSLMYYFFGTIWGQHENEQGFVRLLQRLVKEGDVFFDLGANFGFYTCYVAPLTGKSGAVHSFEANPNLIPHLLRSKELNKECGNIHINGVAVGKDPGKFLTLYDPEWIGCSSLYAHEWLNRGSKVIVPVTTVDEYVKTRDIKRIDVMKIDIEGAELDALQGMEATFRTSPPRAIVSELTLLPDQDDPLRQTPQVLRRASTAADPKELIQFLERRGYQLWGISDDGLLSPWQPSKLTANEPLKLANAAFVLPELKRQRPEMFAT